MRASRLQLVVTPHPDDEVEGWSVVERSEDVHTVWLTATHGEGTACCDPAAHAANLQVDLGDVPPAPAPTGSRTASCGAARLASWTTFLSLADVGDDVARASLDAAGRPRVPASATAPPARDVHLPGAGDALVWSSGERTLVALDGGDGHLRAETVRAAVRALLGPRPSEGCAGGSASDGSVDARPPLVPDLPLERVVAAAYACSGTDALDGTGEPNGWAVYRHPDHLAARAALLDPDLAAELAPRAGVLVTTWPSDPAASLSAEVPRAEYDRLMGLGPPVDPGDPASVRRDGLAQRLYGWLGNPGGLWPPTELPVPDASGAALVMARRQTFVVVGGASGAETGAWLDDTSVGRAPVSHDTARA